jgi:TolB protein
MKQAIQVPRSSHLPFVTRGVFIVLGMLLLAVWLLAVTSADSTPPPDFRKQDSGQFQNPLQSKKNALLFNLSNSQSLLQSLPEGCKADGLYPSPNGQWVSVQINCEEGGMTFILQTLSGQVWGTGMNVEADSIFLGWSHDGNGMILLVDTLGNPRVYLIDIASNMAQLIPVPPETYNVALSPDGQRMIYTLTKGLGYGSETWIADIDGQNARRILAEPAHLITFARWSPTGEHIAYIRIPDSNVPFPVGELWITNGEGDNPILLAEADGGRGHELIWSPDGGYVAFVGRENPNDPTANLSAERLISNIYIADMTDQTVFNATQFSGALTENPVWLSGNLLAFNTNAGGSMDVWTFDILNQQLQQTTSGANIDNAAWLLVGENGSNTP